MKLLRIFAAVFLFAGILAGCLALLLLVLLMVRFPLLLITVLLACWVFCRLVSALAPRTVAADSSTATNLITTPWATRHLLRQRQHIAGEENRLVG